MQDPWVRRIPWRRKWQPTPVILPGEFHEQRSLAGYSPWSCKESGMTEQLSLIAHSSNELLLLSEYKALNPPAPRPLSFGNKHFPISPGPVCQGLGTLLTTGGGPAAFEMGLSWPRMQCHLERELLASVPYWYLIDTCMRACSVASVVSDSVRPYRLWPARLLCPWDSPGKNTGVSCQVLLLGIFPTRGSKPESPALAGGFFTTEPTEKPQDSYLVIFKSITCWNDNIPNKPVLSNTYY